MVFSLLTTLCAYVWPTCSFTAIMWNMYHGKWLRAFKGSINLSHYLLSEWKHQELSTIPSQALCIHDLVQEKSMPILQKSKLLLRLVNLWSQGPTLWV